MSDQQPPPKFKSGALRDRIAAFEKSAGGAAPTPAPVPRRSKLGGVSWKPKTPSPPTSPLESDALSDKKSSMSASDAKESIKTGGTLKERMAALQNRGGFGAPPPVSPKPSVEKPKWRPPPVVAPVDKDDDNEPSRDVDPAKLISPVRRTISDEMSADEKDEGQPVSSDQIEDNEAAAADPEEEERQRRAAIAARMARLGGARVGMAPVFGRPTPMKKAEPVVEPATLTTPAEKTTDEDTSQKDEFIPPSSTHESMTTTAPASEERPTVTPDTAEPPVRKDSGSSRSLSAVIEAQATRSPPISMPVPSAPRRAAPPRRKAPKAPETTPPAVSEQFVSVQEDVPALGEQDILDAAPATYEDATEENAGDVEETGEVDKIESKPDLPSSSVIEDAEDMPPVIARDFVVEADESEEPSDDIDVSKDVETPVEEPAATELVEPSQVVGSAHSLEFDAESADEDAVEVVDDDKAALAEKDLSPEGNNVLETVAHDEEDEEEEKQEHLEEEHGEIQRTAEVKEEELVTQIADEDEEDEEAARRKRIAEKLAKMGGVNPFALPPQRKPSDSSEDIQTPPALTKRSSISRSSVGSLPPQRRQSSHASIVESSLVVEPESELAADSPPSLPIMEESESVAMDKESIDSEDDTREINQDAKTDAVLTYTADDDNEATPAREGHETFHELVTDPVSEVNSDEGASYETMLSDAEPEAPPPPPPRVPHSSTRPISVPPVDPAVPIDPVPRHEDITPAVAHPTSLRRSLPPPPRLVPETPEPEEDLIESELENESSPPLAPPSPLSHSLDDEEPPRRLPPRQSAPSAEQTDDETPPLPVPHRRSMQSDDFNPASEKRLSTRPSRSIPLPPTVSAPVSDAEDSDFGEVLPTPPRHRPATPATPPAPPNEIPLIVPPPVSDESVRRVEPSPLRQSSYPEATEQIVQVPPLSTSSGEASPALLSPPSSSPIGHGTDQEVLDEEEGDPIDPSFHSPSRRTSFLIVPSDTSPPAPGTVTAPEEDEQAARRRTLAERMAKLGGIKFGAAPPVPNVARSPPPVSEEEETEEDTLEQSSEAIEPTEEEEEQARKERIAAKLAMMGGMRIGMMPLGVGAVRPQASHVLTEERPPAPPSRTPPARPPRPQTQESDEQESELSLSQYSNAMSDEGVKVEVEDSDIEEVSHADAQEMEEESEEVPPPVPARGPRRRGTTNSESEHSSTGPPPPPRPPVPTTFPNRSGSAQSASSMARQSSVDSIQGVPRTLTYKPQSEYVMVEEPSGFEEDIPPPPPARPSHRPPPRTAPPPPPGPSVPISDSISSQWEMPSIPSGSIEFSTPADISLSWPEDSSVSSSSRPPPAPQRTMPVVDVDVPRSSDDLMTVWGRVGVQICEVATTLFEKSKKSLIGDGTYDGFIRAVLSEVPNAAMPPALSASYGHLVYSQTGTTVQKRASEILPGDIMVLEDAKLKGHKGLQSYHQNVGIGQPLVGVVSEFEPKKSKVRLFQANQHVGQQTVEAVSYRLEDLKSGTVKVFRVLEN